MVDPPNGWKHGFPKPMPYQYTKNESLMRIWLEQEGYPAKDMELALRYSRFWETEIKE